MGIRITVHSCGDNGTVSTTENIHNVIDKMIYLTAKLTERFASDIVYDIASLESAMQTKNKIDHLLFFRENGVETIPTKRLDVERYEGILTNFIPIQTWRLTHDPDTMETKFIRVTVYKDIFGRFDV